MGAGPAPGELAGSSLGLTAGVREGKEGSEDRLDRLDHPYGPLEADPPRVAGDQQDGPTYQKYGRCKTLRGTGENAD